LKASTARLIASFGGYSASRMAHTFKMKNRDPAVRRPPQRRCIYCDATTYRLKSDRKLGDEHVIAEGLGGNLVLQEASCEACETAIMGFEPAVLRTILYAPRVHLGIRRKRRKRGEEAIKVRGSSGGDEVEIDLPIKNVPVLLFLLRLGLPGILIGRPPELADVKGAWVIHLNPDKPIVPPGFKSFASPVMDTYKFAQFLAKIAHGFAIEAFGHAFNPLLLDFIRAKATDTRHHLIGSASPDEDTPSDHLHELSADWRKHEGTNFAIVKIRLFANLGAPTYLVVAGTSKAS
jgi:hypothetical protein